MVLLVTFHTHTKVVGIMRQIDKSVSFFPFINLCAKSVIIHTSITYKLIKTDVGVNCNFFSGHLPHPR